MVVGGGQVVMVVVLKTVNESLRSRVERGWVGGGWVVSIVKCPEDDRAGGDDGVYP